MAVYINVITNPCLNHDAALAYLLLITDPGWDGRDTKNSNFNISVEKYRWVYFQHKGHLVMVQFISQPILVWCEWFIGTSLKWIHLNSNQFEMDSIHLHNKNCISSLIYNNV